jgi:hypothetical protein
MQIYLYHYPKLKGALYFAICKDNDEIHVEFVERDEQSALQGLEKASRIIKSQSSAKEHESAGPYNFYCKHFCDYKENCFSKKAPDVSCRSCENIRLTDDGWECNLTSMKLSIQDQLKACEKYKRLF